MSKTKLKVKNESIFQGIIEVIDPNNGDRFRYEQSSGKVFSTIPSDDDFIFIGVIRPKLKRPSVILKHCIDLEWKDLCDFVENKFIPNFKAQKEL